MITYNKCEEKNINIIKYKMECDDILNENEEKIPLWKRRPHKRESLLKRSDIEWVVRHRKPKRRREDKERRRDLVLRRKIENTLWALRVLLQRLPEDQLKQVFTVDNVYKLMEAIIGSTAYTEKENPAYKRHHQIAASIFGLVSYKLGNKISIETPEYEHFINERLHELRLLFWYITGLSKTL